MNFSSEAFERWSGLLGPEAVLRSEDAAARYGFCASSTRSFAGALQVSDSAKVPEIVRIAASTNIPLYAISTGKNWGYGNSLPVKDDCVLLDLSSMNKIVEFDEELGLVTIEPGVTQQQLFEFLNERQAPFYVPATGSSPHCSIIGNALERGFGILPHFDHFEALTWLEAVLANGEVYRSGPAGEKLRRVAQSHRYGIGPYLDGIFSQGNLGIVTRATIALGRKSDDCVLFSFVPKDEAAFQELIPLVRDRVCRLERLAVSMKFSNDLYLNATTENFRPDSRGWDSQRWSFWGLLFGETEVLRARQRLLVKTVKPFSKVVSVRANTLRKSLRLLNYVPPSMRLGMLGELNKGKALLDLADGKPSGTGLRLLFPKTEWSRCTAKDSHPESGQHGVLWYPALLPFTKSDFIIFRSFVEEICARFKIPPVTTATVVSEVCLVGLVALIFDRTHGREQAMDCYHALIAAGLEKGFIPYRAHIDSMKELVQRPGAESYALATKIREALDPMGILSPGRYEG